MNIFRIKPYSFDQVIKKIDSPQAKVLDRETLDDLMELFEADKQDPTLAVRELWHIYQVKSEIRITELEFALEHQNESEILRICHELRSMSDAMGAENLRDIYDSIEQDIPKEIPSNRIIEVIEKQHEKTAEQMLNYFRTYDLVIAS